MDFKGMFSVLVGNTSTNGKMIADNWKLLDKIINQNNTTFILLGIVIVMGVVIIINQIRLRKQLRQIQEQLSRAEAGGSDTANE